MDYVWPKPQGGILGISWRFAEANANDVERDPIQEEFFSNSNTLTDLSSLIRESIQNSLDAHEKNGPSVQVRFAIGEVDLNEVKDDFFDALDVHLEHSLTSSHHLPKAGKCRFMLVEDFNTTGLLGRVNARAAEAEQNRDMNSYRYFRWQNGSSSKAEGKRGKWGIGKVVFPKVSAIKTFFAYSVRTNTSGLKEEILFGQSLLKFHSVGNQRKKPDGWWGGSDGDGLDVPVGSESLQKFREVWSVKRNATQNGLSILIPFVDPTFTSQEIRNCVLHDYFIAISDGTLTVEVSDKSGTSILSKETLPSLLDEIEATDPKNFICKVARIYLSHIDNPLDLTEVGDGESNSWNEVTFDDAVKAGIRQKLEDGESVGFKVKTFVTGSVEKQSSIADFTVILTRYQGVKEKPIICREGILIPNASPNYMFDVVAIVNVQSGDLADLLGNAEGPAHESWSANRDRFKDKYQPVGKAAEILAWVRGSARELNKMLKSVDDGQDDYFLGNFFPMASDGQRGEVDGGPIDPKEPRPPKPPKIDVPPPNPLDIRITKNSTGFRIGKGSGSPIGKKYAVRIAYETRRGDAFSKWTADDFNLKTNLRREFETFVEIDKNQIFFTAASDNFEILCDGFDTNRDLIFSSIEVIL